MNRNMEKHGKNKENKSGNACISSIFKVKKCLFDRALHDKNTKSSAPNSGKECLELFSPIAMTKALALEDSPYALSDVEKKITVSEDSTYSIFNLKRRTTVPVDSPDPLLNVKKKTTLSEDDSPYSLFNMRKKVTVSEGSPFSLFNMKKKATVAEDSPDSIFNVALALENSPYALSDVEKKITVSEDSTYAIFNLKRRTTVPVDSPDALFNGKKNTTLPEDDSPFSLFKVKKKATVLRRNTSNCSDNSPFGSIVATPTNKKYPVKDLIEKEQSCCSSLQSPSHVKLAVQKSIMNPDLIGDFTKPCTLPTIRGRHPDLKTISAETVATLLQGSETTIYSLLDCRYPYEFDAGHIKTARNIYIKEDMERILLNKLKAVEKNESTEVLIFYCEFSSERAPSMLRHLRSIDRDMNRDCYPFLHYPELYVIEGGYKEFFSGYKELCDPQQYKMMLDKDCTEELAHYRSKCKSLNRRSKHAKRARSSLLF